MWDVIKTAMIRAGIKSFRELAEATGIKEPTLTQTRRKNPKSFIWYEILQLDAVLKFTDTEWMQLKGAV